MLKSILMQDISEKLLEITPVEIDSNAIPLIKNPNVILADEPTGNLDSVTGKQIFELLKELSKEKLVVIVSHDNENAQKYADRIIELKDGNIIKDTDEEQGKLKNTAKFNLISAKLPFKYSLKMGLGNLVHKKIKLFFTILLTAFAITCLGVMISATSFNMTEEHIKTLVMIRHFHYIKEHF